MHAIQQRLTIDYQLYGSELEFKEVSEKVEEKTGTKKGWSLY